MADESMVRTLDAQARAIWPQESELIRRYGLSDDIRILDVGCGTGEASSRLAEMFPRAEVLGVDVLDQSLERARSSSGSSRSSRSSRPRSRSGRPGPPAEWGAFRSRPRWARWLAWCGWFRRSRWSQWSRWS